VRFSYDQLLEATEALSLFIFQTNANDVLHNVSSFGPDVINNQVVVNLIDIMDEQVSLFNEIALQYPFIIFEQANGFAELIPSSDEKIELEDLSRGLADERNIAPQNAIQVRPGDRIFFMRSGILERDGTVGYSARMNVGAVMNQRGFVTAAHLGTWTFGRTIRQGDRLYNAQGQHIGTVHMASVSPTDAAFVVLPNNVTFVSGLVVASHNIVGRMVHMTGGASGTSRNGPILQIGQRANIMGQDLRGDIVGFPVINGDSGNMVFTSTPSSSIEVNGIVVADMGNRQAFITTIQNHGLLLNIMPN